MPMYKWNVRTVRISHDYIEEIVEAKSAEEAELMVDPCGYDDRDDGWQVDENPELFINDDYTERMDKLFPDDYANPDEVSVSEGTLAISQYTRGYLFAKGEALLTRLEEDDEPWEDEWNSYELMDGIWYAINVWRDNITDKVHCSAYAFKDAPKLFEIDGSDWTRLW